MKKYKNKELTTKRKYIVTLVFICILSIGLLFYQSIARYQDKKVYNSLNNNNRTEFAFYNGDQKLDTIPLKDSGTVFIRSECDNGATVKWDDANWAPAVYNLNKAKTSCTLYFGSSEDRACSMYPEGAACKYYKAGETDEILYDDTEDKNLRFVGDSPSNYVYFNCEDGVEASADTCETWRIIGIMNNVEDENGSRGSHLKIIRDKFDKNYSWDSSASGINYGHGINEWSEADIEKVLNDEYLNRSSGTNKCYKNYRNTTETCPDWANIGIRESSRNMISSVKWHTGTMPVAYGTAKYMYESEQSSHTGKELCQGNGGQYCNDDVDRTTTWIGKVGLMYTSDYGYAVGGNVRTTCLGKSISSYSSGSCMTYNWLYDASNRQWAMTPVPDSSNAYNVFLVNSSGSVSSNSADYAYAVRPTLFLISSVKIIDGNGEKGTPFVLEM